MKNSLLLSIVFFASTITLLGQRLDSEKIYDEFETCIHNYLKSKYVKDSDYLVYYGNSNNFKVNKYYSSGGAYYSVEALLPEIDTSLNMNKYHFNREIDFRDFMRMMISQVAGDDCNLPILNGTIFFIHCPNESWEQFHFDEIIYADNFYLTPTIDIIKADEKEKYHKREILVCKYSRKNGFAIENAVKVRESLNCK
ncbi:hypothetical protein [Chitinophaga silvatica]|nr:hypothetical protein [Chitinophaga silvatica]